MNQAQPAGVPKRLPLIVEPSNRDQSVNTDAKIVNGYVNKEEDGQYWIYKRAGLNQTASLGAGQGLGIFQWNNDIYAVVAGVLYKNGVSLGAVSASSRYTFNAQIGGTPKLLIKNLTTAYAYNTGSGLVHIVDADYPPVTVPGAAYLDGTTYVMDATGLIFGSDINDFTSWDPLNQIRAQIEPDAGVAIAKQLVYIIAFKQWSTEVFFDATNATGSPLSPVQGAKLSVGCVNGDSVLDIEGVLVWLSQSKGGCMIMSMDSLKATQISTRAIDRILDQMDTSSIYAWWFKHDGHRFYCITFKNNNITLAYDLREKLWMQYTYNSGASENYFPIVSSTWSGTSNLVQGEADGKIYAIDSDNLTDAGNQITFDLVTPNFDGGTRRKKMLTIMDIIADQVQGSTLYIRHSDDDYKSYSNFRTADLSRKRPYLKDCGTFRRRAYHFRHTAATHMRLQAMELQIELGTM